MNQPGLNVVGWATAPTGVGEACRGTLAALAGAGLPNVVWDLVPPPLTDKAGAVVFPVQPYDVTLFHANADMTPQVTGALAHATTGGPYRIGYWFWELAHFPLCFGAAFRCLDEVWAPSRFCERAYQSLSPIPVRWMPPAVLPPASDEHCLDRAAFGVTDDEFLLFHAFDMLSVPDRKNPLGLVEAFRHACRHSATRLRLLLKINHADAEPSWVAAIEAAARGLPVTVATTQFTRAAVNNLMNACDAYISLHRSEGLGLSLIEAMYRCKPVIATGYGGVTDFLNDRTGWVVRHGLTELDRPLGPYPAGAVWAAPDPKHAGDLICEVAAEPGLALERSMYGRDTVRALYLPEVFASRVSAALEEIKSQRSDPPASG